jgi:formylglycine-generating enzyme required for sulfatase activity
MGFKVASRRGLFLFLLSAQSLSTLGCSRIWTGLDAGDARPSDQGVTVEAALDAPPDAPPDLSSPDVPSDLPSPDGPTPDVPRADTSPPDGPTPDAPTPDVPTPDAPTPDAPTPDAPVPDGGVSGVWKTVQNGVFMMGSLASESCRIANEDYHQVTLTRKFEIQTTEVTQAQFLAVMGYNPAYFKGCGLDCPVEVVRWSQAAAYCNALSTSKSLSQCYLCTGSGTSVSCDAAAAYSGANIFNCPGYRLPTEAEFEYAQRAGSTTPYYSGSNSSALCTQCSPADPNATSIAWHCANANSSTHPVGTLQANAWGLYDMSGNVWEWCHDWYTILLGTGDAIDPWGPATGTQRTVRSGGWDSNPRNMRSAFREAAIPTIPYDSVGFRCIRTLP